MIAYGNVLRLPCLGLMLMAHFSAQAEVLSTPEKMLLAGEIVVNKPQRSLDNPIKESKSTVRQSKKIVPEQKPVEPDDSLEEGVLSPRGGAPADQREYDARMKEKSRQQAIENTVYPVAPPMYLPMPVAAPAAQQVPAVPNAQDRAGARSDKARAYITQGGEPATAVNARKNSASSLGR